MIEIEIDHNEDMIVIKEDNQPVYELEPKRAYMNNFTKFFEELFNRMGDKRLEHTADFLDIKLTEINEDTRTTIGEW